ncbi:MAG: sugar transferase, partial [Verrucomicrobiae bacterium]|nr:sugar transferase [Verrucomicrobiae bacterium]
MPDRIIDICLGTAFLAATLPVSATAALAVKLSGAETVLERHNRTGPYGHPFREYRFRCSGNGEVTPIGRFLIHTR